MYGATGATGRRVVDQALAAGHEVVAVARRPADVAPRRGLLVRGGDVLDPTSLHDVCRDADAVVSCVGPRSNLRPGTVMSTGTAHMVAAAEASGVARFVFQSGIGLSDGAELTRGNRWVLRAVWRPLFAAAINDKAKGEGVVRASAVEWVIVRPVVLRDAPASGQYLAGPRVPVAPLRPLPFGDCAACLLRAVADAGWARQVINLGRS